MCVNWLSCLMVTWLTPSQLWRVADVASVVHPILDAEAVYTYELALEKLYPTATLTARDLGTGNVVRACFDSRWLLLRLRVCPHGV